MISESGPNLPPLRVDVDPFMVLELFDLEAFDDSSTTIRWILPGLARRQYSVVVTFSVVSGRPAVVVPFVAGMGPRCSLISAFRTIEELDASVLCCFRGGLRFIDSLSAPPLPLFGTTSCIRRCLNLYDAVSVQEL